MQKSITAKQKLVLATIKDLKTRFGKSPTLEEIRKALGYSGISSVQRHVDALKKKGYLSRGRYQARSLEVELTKETVSIPLVGNVPCGTPLLAIENVEAYVPYKKSLIKGNSDDYFFLRAIGDSMDRAKISGKTIDSGDFVLIKKQPGADFGSRVVALIGGEDATIKKMVRGNGCIRLEPESSNPKNKPIILFNDSSVQGVVVDVIKKGN